MTLSESDILHVDAASIMGLLIFFTIGADTLIGPNTVVMNIGSEDPELRQEGTQILVTLIILSMIFPFLISGLYLMRLKMMDLRKSDFDAERYKEYFRRGVFFTMSGFLYIMAGLSVIFMMRFSTFISTVNQ